MAQSMMFHKHTHIGKGDLVGCDISLNLMHGHGNGQHQGNSGQGGQDWILKSSSDVKVGQFAIQMFCQAEKQQRT